MQISDRYQPLFEQMSQCQPAGWTNALKQALENRLAILNHGDLDGWLAALTALPGFEADAIHLDRPLVTASGRFNQPGDPEQIETLLQRFHPWRKGPFELAGINIDTEWRSDLKWQRLQDQIHDLQGRVVLDVGCGNGYYGWRMAGAGARLVLGIDPTLVYVVQFFACRHFLGDPRVWVLPLGIEHLPPAEPLFDSIFSMGVLYHRKSPIDHLLDLYTRLRPGGELILETLVVEGGQDRLLIPKARYARMPNVWFIPSVAMLERWLERCQFIDIKLLDVSSTNTREQRRTPWMRFESLAESLAPDDNTRTLEGHPAPLRAILTASKKSAC